MTLPLSEIGKRLDAAVLAAESEARARRESLRARRNRREEAIEALRALHDRLLRLGATEDALPDELSEAAGEEMERLLGELAAACEITPRDDAVTRPAEVTVAPPDTKPVDLVASPPGTPATVVARPKAAGSDDVAPPAGDPAQASAADAVHAELDRVYQEILTLEENADHLPREELHARVDLLLARLRLIQDGPRFECLDPDARHFMTTRFGLLGSLQKRYQLGFLSPLNRAFATDWGDYIRRLESRLTPLPERLEEIRRDRDLEFARRRAAQEHAARRQKEGEELLDELRLFLCAPEVSSPERLPALRRLVLECMACLGADHRPLVGLLEPHQSCFEGREFKALRRNFKRLGRDEDSVAPRSTEPSTQADREAGLEGAYAGRVGLVIGGMRREMAEDLLRSHLGLAKIEWVPAQDVMTAGPGHAERLIAEHRGALVILLEEMLGDAVVLRLAEAASGMALARVPRGQTLEMVLRAVPTPPEGPPVGDEPTTVTEAIERAVAEHGDSLICAWNSASEPRDYPFLDAASVYRALVFLATTYRDARAGRVSCPDLDHSLREACGFTYRPHQSACTVGQFPEAYGTIFDGRRHELMEHIGKGAGRDPRHSIRLAFTWLPEREAVLLGFIGQHQPTRAS